MDLAGLCFKGLTSLPVTVAGRGDWSDGDGSRINWSLWQYWRGLATCSEPWVAMIFVYSTGVVHWCKGGPLVNPCLGSAEGEVQLQLALGSSDAGLPELRGIFRIGGVSRDWSSTVASSFCVPPIPDRREFRTGVIETFSTYESNPAVGLFMLFIARRDVKYGRSHRWRLRRDWQARSRIRSTAS